MVVEGGYTISRLLAMALSDLARLKKDRGVWDLPALPAKGPSPRSSKVSISLEFDFNSP